MAEALNQENVQGAGGAPQAAPTPENGGRRFKKRRAAIILLVLAINAAALGLSWWVSGKTDVSTDDAFVDGHVFQISARVAGHVKAVPVGDNQQVGKGDLLVELDRSDFETQVNNAASSVADARNQVSSDYAKLDSAQANVSQMKAALELAEKNLARGEDLFNKGIISRQDLDQLATARKVADSQLRAAEEDVRKAKADIGLLVKGGNEAVVRQKEAVLAQARLNLGYTAVTAPSDGYITRKSVEPGNNVQPGQPLMALVSLGDTWVTANYKESQLTHVQPGQKVDFTVDAYPGREFKGTVDSIMAGTGAAFSLLPPENATGNYVKTVQRVPVKITVDPGTDPKHLLRVGMSVVPTIHTGLTVRQIFKEAFRF